MCACRPLVDRRDCHRNCTGPIIRPIKRLGKLGKRSPSPEPRGGGGGQNMKDPRHVYLSFDEATTHVGQRSFRLLACFSDAAGAVLTTAISPPVRVLANNDAPSGAAHLSLVGLMPSSWAGWGTKPAEFAMLMPVSFQPRAALAAQGRAAAAVTPERVAETAENELRCCSLTASFDSASPLLHTATHGGLEGPSTNELPKHMQAIHLESCPRQEASATKRACLDPAPLVSTWFAGSLRSLHWHASRTPNNPLACCCRWACGGGACWKIWTMCCCSRHRARKTSLPAPARPTISQSTTSC